MARMSIDDGLGRDTRLEDLAEFCGWTIRETAGCLQLDIWPLCYDRVTPNIRARDIDRAANRRAITPVKHAGGFSAALVESGLGRPATKQDASYLWVKNDGSEVQLAWKDTEWRDRIYVCGAAERIAYLLKKEEAGRAGGTKSAESRANRLKSTSSSASHGASSTRSPPANPSASASVPDSAPDLDLTPERDRASPTSASIPPPFSASGDPETDSAARRVLDRLTDETGTAYTSPEHLGMVVDRLAEGVDELDLRAVVVYCADVKGWGKPGDKHAGNLRPSTLFGSRENLNRYLADARAEYAEEIAEEREKANRRGDAA